MTDEAGGATVGRVLAGLFVMMLVASLFPLVGAIAQQDGARDVADACQNAPEDEFTDTGDDGTSLEEAIDCIAWYGITSGTSATEYSPSQDIIRAQMATFLADKMRQSETEFDSADGEDRFGDDDGSVHENNIDFVAKHEVAQGFDDDSYGPIQRVSRAQMATFIVQETDAIGAELPEPSQDYFTDDDDSTHEANINVLAELRIATGTGGDAYDPGGFVSRAQMARFIARNLDYLVEQGFMVPPDERGPDVPSVIEGPELIAVNITDREAPAPGPTGSPSPTATATNGDGGPLPTPVVADAAVAQAQPTSSPGENGSDTTVEFVFDEEVTEDSVDPANFRVYDDQAEPTEANNATRDPQDDTAVLAEFDSTAIAEATVATAANEAVADDDDVANPERGLPLEGEELRPETAAPDLQSVTVEEEPGPIGATTNKIVTYTFDQDVALGEGNFVVYEQDGTRTVLPGGFGIQSSCAVGDEPNEVECTVNDQESSAEATAVDNAVLGSVTQGAVADADDSSLTNYETSAVIERGPSAGPTGSPSPTATGSPSPSDSPS